MPHTLRRPWRALLVAFLACDIGPHRPMSQAAPAPVVRGVPVSQWERLLVADPSLPFNGQGSMRRAMTGKWSAGWNKAASRKADAMMLDPKDPNWKEKAEAATQAELDGERLALIAWAKSLNARNSYESDAFVRDPRSASRAITAKYLNRDGSVRIKSIIEARCVRCHCTNDVGRDARRSLETYEGIARYTRPEKREAAPKP